jgi:hypothetical protein
MTRRVFMLALAALGLLPKKLRADGPALEPPAHKPGTCVLCGYDRDLKTWFTGHGVRWDAKRGAFFPVINKLPPREDDVLRCADAGGCQARLMNTYVGTQTDWQKQAVDSGPRRFTKADLITYAEHGRASSKAKGAQNVPRKKRQ